MKSEGSYCWGHSSRWQKQKHDFSLMLLNGRRAALCLGRTRMDKPFREKMIPGKRATFFLEECWKFWWPGMEKENLCTLKSFMASGAEAFAQAQVVRAPLFAEPPAKRAGCVHAPQPVTPATRKHTSMRLLQPGLPRKLRINDQAEQNVNL